MTRGLWTSIEPRYTGRPAGSYWQWNVEAGGHTDQLGQRCRSHLPVDATAVDLHGSFRGSQFSGDPLVRQAGDDPPHNFLFPDRQRRVTATKRVDLGRIPGCISARRQSNGGALPSNSHRRDVRHLVNDVLIRRARGRRRSPVDGEGAEGASRGGQDGRRPARREGRARARGRASLLPSIFCRSQISSTITCSPPAAAMPHGPNSGATGRPTAVRGFNRVKKMSWTAAYSESPDACG